MKNGASSTFAPFPSDTLSAAGRQSDAEDVLGAAESSRSTTGPQQRMVAVLRDRKAGRESSPDPLQSQDDGAAGSTFDTYRDVEPPPSSLPSVASRPRAAFPFPSPPASELPGSSSAPQLSPAQSASSSSPAADPVARPSMALARPSSLRNLSQLVETVEDSPDPLRIIPARPSRASSAAPLSKSKGNGKGKKKARSRNASAEPTTSSPRAPGSGGASTGQRASSTTPRPTGGASALDGAEENVGFAATRGDVLSVAEEGEASGPSSSALGSNGEIRGKKGAAVMGKGKARRSSPGGFASQTLGFDCEVPTRVSMSKGSPRDSAESPAPSSSLPTLTPSQPVAPDSPDIVDESPAEAEPRRRTSRAPKAATQARPSLSPGHSSGSTSRRASGAQSTLEFDFVAKKFTRRSSGPSSIPPPPPPPPAVDDSAAAPSSDLTSVADTVLTTSPDRQAVKRSRPTKKAFLTSSDEAESSVSPKKKRRVPRASQVGSSDFVPDSDVSSKRSGSDASRSAADLKVIAAALFDSPKRRKSVKAAVKDYSSEEEEDADVEEYREAPKKKPRPSVSKSKAAAKSPPKAKSSKSDATPQSSPTSSASTSSPNKPFPSQSSSLFARQLAVKSVAPRETAEQRAKGWELKRMDQLVWVRIEKDGVGFWWPADIASSPRSIRPLKVTLLLDDENEILEFAPSPVLDLDDPSHLNLLSFRTGPKLRFDKTIFHDEDAPSAAVPSPTLFDHILGKAVELETVRGQQDDEEALPAPSGKSTARSGSPLKSRADESEEDSGPDPEAEEADVEEDGSDAELLRDEDESAGFTFPTVVLARSKRQWWGARLLGYNPPPSPTKGDKKSKKKRVGKFTVEWVDASITEVERSDILTSLQPAFFTVKMGTTLLDLPKDYTATLVAHAQTLFPVYQRIIDEDYPPASDWLEDFYQGGKARDNLAKRARFGELQDQHTEALQQELTRWGRGVEGPRPTGSDRYEALSDSERARFVSDILLPLTVFLVIIHEHDFEEEATERLAEEGTTLPSADEVIARAFLLAHDEFERGSIQKSILAARSAKQAADVGRRRR